MVTLYHGGVPGLKPGELLLPPATTGAACKSDMGHDDLHRRDRVYMIASEPIGRYYAAVYACQHPDGRRTVGGGDVYRVEPVGEARPDPDGHAHCGLSWEVPAARVVGVVARAVEFTVPQAELEQFQAFHGITAPVLAALGELTLARVGDALLAGRVS
jgi:hypothetical protein